MMEQHWITTREVTALTGWHPQHVRRLAREGQLRYRPSKGVRRDGRSPREYALSSLPVEAQLKFLKQPLLSGPDCTALALRSDPNQSNLFASTAGGYRTRAPQLFRETERPGLEAPGSDCAAVGIQQPQPAIPSDVSYHRWCCRAKHELAGRLPRRSAPPQRPNALELVCTVPQAGLCGSGRPSSLG